MQVQISSRPAYAMATLTCTTGETVLCERDAMVTMSEGFDVSATLGGGVVRAGLRKVLGGENFVLGQYTARIHGANISVAASTPGDIAHVVLDARTVMLVEQGAFLACSGGVEVDVRYAGVSKALLNEGLTMLKVAGEGDLLIGAYGAIMEMYLEAGQNVIVDSGHLVAVEDTVNVAVGVLGGATQTVLTGEGLVAHLTGPGRVMIQTRSEQALRHWLFPSKGTRGRR